MKLKKPKLNPNARKWVRALRSGKHKQGTRALRKGDRLCCLGVACEVFRESGRYLEVGKREGYTTYDGEGGMLPPAVQNWLRLRTKGGWMHGSLDSLVARNDCGATFAEIADLIESQPERLFV